MRELLQTARIYLLRARYAEQQAERCIDEEERALWLDSAREYRALAAETAEEDDEEVAGQPVTLSV